MSSWRERYEEMSTPDIVEDIITSNTASSTINDAPYVPSMANGHIGIQYEDDNGETRTIRGQVTSFEMHTNAGDQGHYSIDGQGENGERFNMEVGLR